MPAINVADHESSVGPRRVAWEVVKEQLGSCQNRNDDNLVSTGIFFALNQYRGNVQGLRVLHAVGRSFI